MTIKTIISEKTKGLLPFLQLHLIFSSKDIDPNSTNKVVKKLKKIPTGEFHNARFDIDPIDPSTVKKPNSANPCNQCYDKFKNSAFCNQSTIKEQCNCLRNNDSEYPKNCYSCLDSYCD